MTGSVAGARPTRAWCKAILVLGILTVILWPSRGTWAQSPAGGVVTDVVVVGNRTIPTETILRQIKVKPGQEFISSAVHEDVKRIGESRLFKNVQVRVVGEERVVVQYIVQEHPNQIQDIIYKNAHHIPQKELEDMTRLRKGMLLDPISARKACFEIQDYLKKQGRYFATVSLEEGDKEGDKRVIFNISEGPIVRVRKTYFKGNAELATSARLKTQIDTSTAFLGLPLGGKYNPMLVDHDVLKLEQYYKDNGYLDVRVTRELNFSDDNAWVDITFHIHEGQRYRVGNVSVEGAKVLDRDQVSSVLRTRRGEHYNENIISADLRNITDQHGWRGYPVYPQKELYFPEPGIVNVVYDLRDQERPPTKVGQVIIIGNEVTQDRVIRRVVGLYPGQILRFPELRIAERDLARLNIFEMNPEMGTRPTLTVLGDERDEYRDILVQVKETPTGSFLVGMGVNSDAGLVGSIVLNERNFDLFRPPRSFADILEGRAFRGAGQELRIEAVPGTELQRYTVLFREPFLFDRPYSLTVSGYYVDRVFEEYTEGRVGGRFTLGHQLTKSLSLSGSLRLEGVNVSNVPFFAPADYTDVIGSHFLVAPSAALTWDTRDSYLRPTEGGIANFSYEHVLGDFNFPVFNVEASRYFGLFPRPDGSGKHVIALRSQFSWAGTDAPVFERFFAGGFRSLRGFEFRGVSPTTAGFQVGGDFMFLNSVEYQVPVKANDQIYFVGFVDSGTVERRIDIRDYRVAAGVGARIIVPMLGPVPIALDFGFPIVRGPTDREQLFSFWVGLFR